jgi:hypothetical protein
MLALPIKYFANKETMRASDLAHFDLHKEQSQKHYAIKIKNKKND